MGSRNTPTATRYFIKELDWLVIFQFIIFGASKLFVPLWLIKTDEMHTQYIHSNKKLCEAREEKAN